MVHKRHLPDLRIVFAILLEQVGCAQVLELLALLRGEGLHVDSIMLLADLDEFHGFLKECGTLELVRDHCLHLLVTQPLQIHDRPAVSVLVDAHALGTRRGHDAQRERDQRHDVILDDLSAAGGFVDAIKNEHEGTHLQGLAEHHTPLRVLILVLLVNIQSDQVKRTRFVRSAQDSHEPLDADQQRYDHVGLVLVGQTFGKQEIELERRPCLACARTRAQQHMVGLGCPRCPPFCMRRKQNALEIADLFHILPGVGQCVVLERLLLHDSQVQHLLLDVLQVARDGILHHLIPAHDMLAEALPERIKLLGAELGAAAVVELVEVKDLLFSVEIELVLVAEHLLFIRRRRDHCSVHDPTVVHVNEQLCARFMAHAAARVASHLQSRHS